LGAADEARSWYQRVLEADPRNAEIADLIAGLGLAPAAMDAPQAEGGGESPTLGWAEEEEAAAVSEELLEPPTAESGSVLDAAPESVDGEEAEFEAHEQLSEADELFMPTSLTGDAAGGELDAGSESPVGFEPTHSEEPLISADARRSTSPSGGFPTLDDDEPLDPRAASGADWQFAEDAFGTAAEAPSPAEAGGDSSPYAAAGEDTPTDAAVQIPSSEGATAQSPSFEGETTQSPSFDEATTVQIPAYTVEPPSPAETPLGAVDAHEAPPAEDSIHDSADPQIVTETMAELYLQQGHLDEAISIYQRLVEARPDDAALSDRMVAVQQHRAERSSRTIRNFLAGIAAIRPAERADESDLSSGPDADAGWAPEAQVEDWQGEPAAAESGVVAGPVTDFSEELAEGGAPLAGEEWAVEPLEGEDDEQALGEYESPDSTPVEEETPEPPGDAPVSEPEAAAGGLGPAGAPAEDDRASAAPLPATGNRTIDDLFGGEKVSGEDEAAAGILAQLFTSSERQVTPPAEDSRAVVGRPARPATSELSLDQVFGASSGGESRRSGSFSFDQFFGGNADAPRPRGSEPMQQPPVGEQDDVEQFNAWLQDLKQR
jgi:tetratricopeptide (TPR) repeat protein